MEKGLILGKISGGKATETGSRKRKSMPVIQLNPKSLLCLFLCFLILLPAVPVRAQESEAAPVEQAEQIDASPEEIEAENPSDPEVEAPLEMAPLAAEEGASVETGNLGVTLSPPESSLFTGGAQYKIPISLPSGRAKMAPNLALTYSSFQKSNWIGVGWSLDMGSIQRSTKHGLKTNSSGKYIGSDFVASINGSTAELVPVGNNIYRSKIEGAFLRFRAVNPDPITGEPGSWEVTSKDGLTYYYGASV